MLAASDIYTDADVVDEVIDFLTAGTQTTSYTVQTALSHFMVNQESLSKARAEFDPFVKSAGSYEAAFRDELNYNTINELQYMSCVFYESLRRGSTSSFSSIYVYQEDT